MNTLNTTHLCRIEDRQNQFYCIDFVMMADRVKIVSWYDSKGTVMGMTELKEVTTNA